MGYVKCVKMSSLEQEKTMIEVVNMKNPSPKPKIKVDRSSVWGNPYILGKHGTRDEVIDKYADWIAERPELIKMLSDLMVKNGVNRLACWCSPLRCHGHVLAKLVEEYRGE